MILPELTEISVTSVWTAPIQITVCLVILLTQVCFLQFRVTRSIPIHLYLAGPFGPCWFRPFFDSGTFTRACNGSAIPDKKEIYEIYRSASKNTTRSFG